MRTSTLSTLALGAASLLVKGAFAKPVITDKVIVTEEIVVTKYPDGKYKTGKAKAVGTTTIKGFVVITTVRPVTTIEDPTSTSTPTPEPTPVVASSSTVPAVFKEVPASSSSSPSTTTVVVEVAKPTTQAPAPTTTSTQAPAPEPTTIAKVVTSAAAPVAPTTTSAAAPVSTSTPSTGGGKRGIAYNDASLLNAFKGTGATWAYNWGGSSSAIPSEFEYVPMLWGLDQHANNWEKWADEAIAAGSKHLLAFNEPDHSQQANLDVGKAASGYIQHMNPYFGKAALGSPAVTNGGAPMGLDWLSRFFDACAGNCKVDFVCVHWYNGGDANAFKEYMKKASEVAGGRKLWITEFEAPGNDEAWLAEVLPWMDSQDFIERYSYFMAAEGSLISGGALSSLGQAYVS